MEFLVFVIAMIYGITLDLKRSVATAVTRLFNS